jgi:two-component system cell cycle response regulator
MGHPKDMNKAAKKDPDCSSVLVVDDEDEVRATLCEIIHQVGYACSGAVSAEKALKMMDEEDVDVVITDIRMSGLDGFAFTDIVKKNYHADVIIITGYSGEFSYEEAMEKGASDFALKPVRPRELIARLRRVLRERRLIAERRRMEEQLRELTVTDDLTKLHNSRHFFEQLQSETARADRYGHTLSLLLMDVDGFKRYNDTYGHLEGDKVLGKLGEVIQGCMRKNDSGYRYGGDEFTVVLPETRGPEATKVAERIRKGFRAMSFSPVPGTHVDASVSIGIAEYKPEEGMTEFAKRADEAMYRAKRQGGNRTLLV